MLQLLLLSFLSTGVVCMPAVLQGSHGPLGWGQVVRLRHLYAARKGVHLQIGADGQIQGSAEQNLYSLLEIQPVSPGCVVLRGVTTTRFLCMEGDGRLYSSRCRFFTQRYPVQCHWVLEPIPAISGREAGYTLDWFTYSRENCTFKELILPDGYSVYMSDHHGALLSLGNQRQRQQGRDRAVPALAQFLPRISTLAAPPGPDIPEQPDQSNHLDEPIDTMDMFGKLSQILHSPSFHTR